MTRPDRAAAANRPPLPFALPDITEAEIDGVVEVLRSKWLTSGARASEFEERFAARVQAPYAVALNSCTAALHLSLEALGVGAGDLVFLSPYTFAASGEVIRYVDAKPVLVDIDPVTQNIDVKALRSRIKHAVSAGEGRPAALMPVHFAGVACDMDEIWSLAREFDLAVVEDAAHAFPSEYQGRPVGWMPADIRGTTCYSFYATKTITTGEGGMLTTSDEAIADRVRMMSLHGLSKQAWNRYAGGSWRYDIVAPGYKYNLTDIAAALGLVQLSRAEQMLERRTQISDTYTEAFSSLPVFECPGVRDDRVSSWHLYVLRLRAPLGEAQRDQMIDDLKARGVGTSMHFIPLHMHSYYRECYGYRPDDFPVAYDSYRRALSLPIYSSMSEVDVQRVVDDVMRIGRPAEMRHGSSSIGAGLALLLLVVGCGGTTPEPKPTAKASGTPNSNPTVLSKPADAVDLDLDASASSFEAYPDNHGQSLIVQGDQGGTHLKVHGGVLEREPPDAFGPTGAPILVIDTIRPVQEVSASYRFTAGSTTNQNAVVGVCDTSFSFGSIQFAVSPVRWVLFYTVRKTATDRVTPIVPIAEGRFATPLATDGTTEYTTTMRIDLDQSSVAVRFPGSQRSFTHPQIADLWGDKAAVQIRRPLATDGNIQMTHVWTWSPT